MPDLSIVVPIWNERHKIAADIKTLTKYFHDNNITAEIIIVDDGSTDGSAGWAGQQNVGEGIQLNIIRNEHRGKGYAVKTGILASNADIVMFMDSGGNVPARFIGTGMNLIIDDGIDLVIGSRHAKKSRIIKNMVWYRRISSWLFRTSAKTILNLPAYLTDTQCGFKLFKGDIARELFTQVDNEGFLFDLELLILGLKNNYRIKELPLEWTCDRDSRLSLGRTPLPLFRDLFLLRKKFNNQ